jgi:paraquat-inducible protein B
MNGIPIGDVIDVRAQFDQKTKEFSVPVTIQVDPARFGVKLIDMPGATNAVADHRKLLDALVARGLRLQLKTGSMISGSLYVSAEFFPDAPPSTLDWTQNPVRLPTQPGQIEAIEASVANVIKNIEQMQFKEISEDLRKTINELNQTLVTTRGTMTNADQLLGSADKLMGSADTLIAPNSVLDTQLGSMLQEVGGAARAMRILADYLERHPEALIRGKTGEAK